MTDSLHKKKLAERTIADLNEGEVAYTTPWALAASRSGYLRINRNYPAYPAPQGTVSMKIQKVGSVIFIQRDTVDKDSITEWPFDRCYPVRLVFSIDTPFKVLGIVIC